MQEKDMSEQESCRAAWPGERSCACPEIPAAAQVLLSHTVVALVFVWVTVIIVLCGVGFCYLVFLECNINRQIGIGRAVSLVWLLSSPNLGTKEERKMT